MKTNSSFRVRVLLSYPLLGEMNYYDLTWQQAVEKFEFLVSCCLAFPEMHIRCVNIIKGKRKSIKMFQNHE